MKYGKYIGTVVLFNCFLLLAINDLHSQESALVINPKDTVLSVTDTIPLVKEKTPMRLSSNTGEDITSQIKKIILNNREVLIDSINKLDTEEIKSIDIVRKKDTVLLYIRTE